MKTATAAVQMIVAIVAIDLIGHAIERKAAAVNTIAPAPDQPAEIGAVGGIAIVVGIAKQDVVAAAVTVRRPPRHQSGATVAHHHAHAMRIMQGVPGYAVAGWSTAEGEMFEMGHRG